MTDDEKTEFKVLGIFLLHAAKQAMTMNLKNREFVRLARAAWDQEIDKQAEEALAAAGQAAEWKKRHGRH